MHTYMASIVHVYVIDASTCTCCDLAPPPRRYHVWFLSAGFVLYGAELMRLELLQRRADFDLLAALLVVLVRAP